MIYDCFLYNGEKDILNLRLHELNTVIDKFIILESNITFQGNKKERYFDNQTQLFKDFLNKIIYIPYTEENINKDPWINEANQRNALSIPLTNLNHNDIIMISDVDEIPDPENLTDSFNGIYSFYHNFYYFNVNVRSKYKWIGTHLFNYGSGDFLKKGFNEIRRLGHHEKQFTPINNTNNFKSGGWHFSNFGDTNFMINKIESFSHTEVNIPKYKDKILMQKCIDEGKDPFNSLGLDLEHIIETYLPKNINLLPESMRK